jgi:hypothetical protein
MRITLSWVLLLTMVGLFAAVEPAGRTSENNDRLRSLLDSHPEADRDGDGVLTVREAEAYQPPAVDGQAPLRKPTTDAIGGPWAA